MNWDDLRIFLSVARKSKLEDVAIQLNVDATTISRRIKRLETDLGQTLFERSRRGHALTASGEALAARVEEMESLSLDIQSGSASEQLAAGRIRLGVPEGLGSTVVAPSLKAFRDDNPKIDIDLIALSGFVSVPKRQADMSILLTRPTAGRLRVRKLSDYSLRLYGTDEYLGEYGGVSTRDDLVRHTLIGYVDDLIYSSQLRYFDELLPGLKPHLCSPSILAQAELVASGAGIGILPEFIAKTKPALVNLLPDEIHVIRTFWLVIHEDVAGLARNRLLSNYLVQVLSDLP